MPQKNTPDKFWSRVSVTDPEDCWEWQGTTNSGGYGNLSWGGVAAQAHRVAYFLAKGGIDLQTGFRRPGAAKEYKQFVLHKCDNRKCCNPTHLFLGSMAENLTDAYAKGRKSQPQSLHTNAALTPSQVREARAAYASGGTTQNQLADRFGVCQRTISAAVRHLTYKDVTP